MAVEIKSIQKNSPAYKAGIEKSDILISINGNEIEDVLDYMFYAADNKLELKLIRGESPYDLTVIKSEYDDLGLEFETFLMDNKRSCHNKCIFCFIDQMPPNMRETLYFKDDDARLSFLQGNYVTLTNLTQKDIDRIINMKLNINVSVHTTNPELRIMMMNNRFAGEKLDYIFQLAKAGIMLNCQIVLCPGINDGTELIRTLSDLGGLMPSIQSIAVVPVGMTKYRRNLYPLTKFTKESSGEAIDIIEGFQKKFFSEYGTRLVYASDEFYLVAERELPSAEEYEDYPQYENGVGMTRSLLDEFNSALCEAPGEISDRNITVACGTLALSTMRGLIGKVTEKWSNLNCSVYSIVNDFFGDTITVTGLITGQDLIKQLKNKNLGDYLLLSSSMIRKNSDVFLDDITISEVEEKLKIKIILSENDGYDLLDKLIGV